MEALVNPTLKSLKVENMQPRGAIMASTNVYVEEAEAAIGGVLWKRCS